MKFLMIMIFFSLTITLVAENYTGTWKINTLGSGSEATISQNKDEISIFRIIKQEFEGEQYILYHLMKGNINDKSLKLYVKEDKLDKFEYLRDVSFKKTDIDTLSIDDKIYKRFKKPEQQNVVNNKGNNNKVEIIYLKKKPNDNNNNNLTTKETKIPEQNNKNNHSSVATQEEPIFLLPAGLGDSNNKELRKIKISLGFTSEEKALNLKAVRLLKRKHYKKAVKIFLKLYKNNNNNISLLIKIENTYSLMGNKKEANKYCKKIKKYDPFYLCGD